MFRIPTLTLISFLALLASPPLGHTQEPPSLLTMIAQWKYPDSKMNGATLGDAATLNGAGERTVQSILYKTVLTTKDPLPKVASESLHIRFVGHSYSPSFVSACICESSGDNSLHTLARVQLFLRRDDLRADQPANRVTPRVDLGRHDPFTPRPDPFTPSDVEGSRGRSR